MGTSLSGLTPATTFDGLLKTSDNEPLDGTLKAISTGDGTDTILSLSNSALKIGGDTEIDSSGLNALIVKRNGTELLKSDGSGLNGGIIFTGNLGNLFSVGVKGNDFNIWDGSYLGGGDLRFSILADGKTGIGAQTPTAQLHIKGSGASAGTTSLLVQNSAGTDMLKVQDDGGVTLGTLSSNGGSILFKSPSGSLTYGEISVNSGSGEMKIGATRNSFFPTFYSSGSEAMRINTSQFVGIGETTPTARLHVKVGTTQDTIARFQDPLNASTYIDIKNDSVLTDYVGLFWGSKAKIRSKEVGPIFFDVSQAVVFADGNAAKTKIYADGSMSIGSSTIPSSTMAYIKGSGATSATTSLLVQNSEGSDVLRIYDNRKLRFDGQFELLYGSAFGIAKTTSSLTLSDYTINNRIYTNSNFKSVLYSDSASGGLVGVNNTAPTAQLHIKGSGNDNTTTSLLVQNSDGTDLFKVFDTGGTRINTETLSSTIIGKNGTGGAFVVDAGRVNNVRADVNGVGINSTSTANTSLTIKGQGATSATTALLVQNSAGTEAFKVRDDGVIIAVNSSYSFSSGQATFGKKLAIGVTANQSSAVLEIASTTQGFLPPRMTTTQRDAINMVGDPAVSTPAAGLIIYNTDTNTAECWNGSAWMPMF